MTPATGELPRLASELHISPFRQGRGGVECFLVETRAGAFLANRKMRCLLEALAEQSSLAGLKDRLEASLGKSVDEAEVSAAIAGLPRSVFQNGSGVRRKTPFLFSFRLLPAHWVQLLAGGVRGLFMPAVVMAVGAVLLLELPWLVTGVAESLGTPLSPGGALRLFLGGGLAALVHELGHAAACAWYGLAPGEIGCGLYLIFPAFYTDVTRAWRLSPLQRAAVDAGGIYFQVILIVLTVPLARVLDARGLFVFVTFNLYLIFHNLNPLFKMDGYWIFSDLAGLPNLHQRTWRVFREALQGRAARSEAFPWMQKRSTWLLLHAYAVAVLIYGIFVLSTLPRWLAVQLQPFPVLAALAPVLVAALLVALLLWSGRGLLVAKKAA